MNIRPSTIWPTGIINNTALRGITFNADGTPRAFQYGSQVNAHGQVIKPREALALETQHFPDSPNKAAFPATILRPGETFRS
ncbi:MAG: hypothetical protein V4673_08580, partial [Pseudomonadota bacterium]